MWALTGWQSFAVDLTVALATASVGLVGVYFGVKLYRQGRTDEAEAEARRDDRD